MNSKREMDTYLLNFTVIGFVTCVSPDPGDIVKNLLAADHWNTAIKKNCKDDGDLHSLVRESDGLMKSLLGAEGSDLSSHVASVPFDNSQVFEYHAFSLRSFKPGQESRLPPPPAPWGLSGDGHGIGMVDCTKLMGYDRRSAVSVLPLGASKGEIFCFESRRRRSASC